MMAAPESRALKVPEVEQEGVNCISRIFSEQRPEQHVFGRNPLISCLRESMPLGDTVQ